MSKKSKLRKQQQNDYQKALSELSDIRGSLGEAYCRFDGMTDKSMMDACILEISALRARYDYAVKNIKSLFFWRTPCLPPSHC